MKGFVSFVIKQRQVIIVIVSLLTLFFSYNLLNLRVNSSPYFMSPNHESRIHEKDIRRLFTNSGEQILVALEPLSGNPLDLHTVGVVRHLSKKLEALSLAEFVDDSMTRHFEAHSDLVSILDKLKKEPFHQKAEVLRELHAQIRAKDYPEKLKKHAEKIAYLYFPIVKVRSFATLENLTSENDELDLHPLLPEGELNEEQLSQFSKEILENPLFRGLLLSDDTRVTTLQIEMSIPKDDNRNTVKLYEKIVDLVNHTSFEGQIYLAGNPVIDAQMAKSMERDNLVFFPFVILVIATILYLGFRTISGIFVPLAIATLTTIWTLGVMVIMGLEQNIVTTILPVFLLTVAVADAIHFYNYFVSLEDVQNSISERLTEVLTRLTKPLLLTSITTLFGFLALAWTDIRYIYEFGILMAVGVVFAFLITLFLAPVLLLDVKSGDSVKPSSLSRFIEQGMLRLADLLMAHSYKSIVLIGMLFLVSIYALGFLKFDQEGINNFDASTVLRQHNSEMLAHFDGTIPIDIWIDTGEQGGIYKPEVIRGIQQIEHYLNQREDIGYVLSPVGFLERMYNLLTHEGHFLPEDFSEQLIAQEILVYENERSQEIKHVIDDQHRHARLIVLGKSDSAMFWEPILKDIEALRPVSTTLQINGYGKVMYSNIEAVIETNIKSTGIALSLIGIVMIILFKSLVMGGIAVAPLILTVLMNYALMASAQVEVDVGTTIVASIAFGIGIDYSIHLLSVLKTNFHEQKMSIASAVSEGLKSVGLPIVINSLTMAGGFLVLTLSNFLVLKLLGLFISLTMLISAINALVIVPLSFYLLHAFKKRKSERI